jgi:hypothetical protein
VSKTAKTTDPLAELKAVQTAAMTLVGWTAECEGGLLKIIGRAEDDSPRWMVVAVIGDDLPKWVAAVEAIEAAMDSTVNIRTEQPR